MLTPHLEKLILSGKASYNTYVIGGAGKNILNVRKNHFIIITDLTYYSQINTQDKLNDLTLLELEALQKRNNTQLKIFSAKTQNNFIFRNNFTIQERGNSRNFHVSAIGNTKLDTYLMHESDISFTFSIASDLNYSDEEGYGVNQSNIGYPPPFDYGIFGQRSALYNSNLRRGDLGGDYNLFSTAGGETYNVEQTLTANQLTFPVVEEYLLTGLRSAQCYPLLNVSYVEISGNPTNIQS